MTAPSTAGLSVSLNNVRFHFCKVSPPFDTRGKFSSVNFKVNKLVIDGKNQIFSMLSALDVNSLSTIDMGPLTSFLQDIEDDNICVDMSTTAENRGFFSLANNVLQHISSKVILDNNRYKTLLDDEMDNISPVERGSSKLTTGSLGMGNPKRETWYGTPDGRIRGGVESETTALYGDDSETCGSDGDSAPMEAKNMGEINICHLISTAVVNSFTEHNLHNLNPLVPTILFKRDFIMICLYDCVNDALVISDRIYVLDDNGRPLRDGILLLWMVINHRIFINPFERFPSHLKSGFLSFIETNQQQDVYKVLNDKKILWATVDSELNKLLDPDMQEAVAYSEGISWGKPPPFKRTKKS